MPFSALPRPPYWTTVFVSKRRDADHAGYQAASDLLGQLSAAQDGFLGIESARGPDGFGITVSYWDSLRAIKNWKRQADHKLAQENGAAWYEHYEVRIAEVKYAYSLGDHGPGPADI
ncbi:antibiotic biosynthesis monooxygenase [Dipodascopsis tothii]|uniref:antibiotic biosynthesis monooxygenase n=1 Tax=Dipodascopsis tothii TaxID=44089 RepID=UPI0034CFDB8C